MVLLALVLGRSVFLSEKINILAHNICSKNLLFFEKVSGLTGHGFNSERKFEIAKEKITNLWGGQGSLETYNFQALKVSLSCQNFPQIAKYFSTK